MLRAKLSARLVFPVPLGPVSKTKIASRNAAGSELLKSDVANVDSCDALLGANVDSCTALLGAACCLPPKSDIPNDKSFSTLLKVVRGGAQSVALSKQGDAQSGALSKQGGAQSVALSKQGGAQSGALAKVSLLIRSARIIGHSDNA
jgi:hypothetical protein